MKWNEGGTANMSKMSYFKYLVKRYWKLELVISAILFMVLSVSHVISIGTNQYVYGSLSSQAIAVADSVMQSLYIMTIFFSCGFSCFTPIYLNYYLYRKQSSDLYLSLPMKREKMFDVHFLYGCVSVLLPTMICFMIPVIALWFKGMKFTALPFQMLGFIILINIILQCINTLLSIKANKQLDAIVAVFGFLIVPLVIILSVNLSSNILLNNVLIGYTAWMDELTYLNVLSRLISLPYVAFGSFEYTGGSVYQIMLSEHSILYLLWWCLIGIIALLYARVCYQKKPWEHSEQYTSSKLIYPLMIHSGLAAILVLVTLIDELSAFKVILIGITFLGYLVVMFFAKRNIKFKWQYAMAFALVYGCTSVFTWSFESTKGYGLIKETPDQADIYKVSVNFSFWNEDIYGEYDYFATSEEFDTYYQLTKELPEKCLDDSQYAEGSVLFRYQLKDGRELYRDYTFFNQDAYQLAHALYEKLESNPY